MRGTIFHVGASRPHPRSLIELHNWKLKLYKIRIIKIGMSFNNVQGSNQLSCFLDGIKLTKLVVKYILEITITVFI
ncbi:hypothetical protein NEPAR06_0672 [Nematocida parisii]|uniref:Uncharacterized protein n=1 Tax=Nematocida parisii (strain ERTm3) TaxID=935791 RepID=I3EHU2_NEMP3|nr:uncharacterized protein NEPG_02388 [Nematocida parisii ERTm1]EIJ88789.1 hypothetical protein NEQG_00608 [Nematocida parisii ERTm3]KAI5125780.1 hypothetical protein NEPAR03_0217 [Nematocida parisii]EIJ92697.1 hypothetical protein NEPG_02388 [Nematocida parisii ERTm1]KAI5126721.1 hypothetical protein NEPAR08_0573 [Nematocida parisii]KAI5140909.1 hypothetical protein NEPAR04_0570 [Nematocida parisii]|eukprot:XP_013060215.1 hypothetical protein NEPG_02388 [Nematocida parisii ERTm1]